MVKLLESNPKTTHEEPDELLSFIFADGVIGQKQRSYIELKLQINTINNSLNDLQSKKDDLLLLQQYQPKKNTGAARWFFGESTADTVETEIKINEMTTQILELQNMKLSAESELQLISVSLTQEQTKKKEQLIQPAWVKKLDQINFQIITLTQEQEITQQSLESASQKKAQSINQLRAMEQRQLQTQATLEEHQQALQAEKTRHSSYKHGFIETIRYWLAIATAGFFYSNRYRSELQLIDLNRQITSLTNLVSEQARSISAITHDIQQQQQVIETQTSKRIKTAETIAQKKQQLIDVESTSQTLHEKVRKKSNNILFLLKKRPLVLSIQRFIEHPTPVNLNKLLSTMKSDIDYLENKSVKKLINQVGKLYTAIEDMHILCETEYNLKQEQIKNGLLLAETQQEKDWKEGIANAETELLLRQDKYEQERHRQLQEARIQLAYEKADQKQSIFLKETLALKDNLARLNEEKRQLDKEYDNQVAPIDDAKTIEQIDVVFRERYDRLYAQITPLQKQIDKLTKKQLEQIKHCYIGIPELTLDIRANELAINKLLQLIKAIEAGQTPQLIALQEEIQNAQKTIDNTKQRAQAVITKSMSILEETDINLSPKQRKYEYPNLTKTFDTFQKSPTNANLTKLTDAMDAELHSKSPVSLLHEFYKIGKVYSPISTTLDTAQKKAPSAQQIKDMILAECKKYIKDHTPKNSVLTSFSIFNKPNTPKSSSPSTPAKSPRPNSPIDELTAIRALKSVLKNSPNSLKSLATLESFIQSETFDDTCFAALLIEQARTIDERIDAIYAEKSIIRTNVMS